MPPPLRLSVLVSVRLERLDRIVLVVAVPEANVEHGLDAYEVATLHERGVEAALEGVEVDALVERPHDALDAGQPARRS